MAAGLTIGGERRKSPRVDPERTAWSAVALLRPGQDVVILNVSCGGALLESGGRMAPGARTELQLLGSARHSIRGRIIRCHEPALEPLRDRGASAFDQSQDLDVCVGA